MEYKCFRNVDFKIPAIGIGTYKYNGGPDVMRQALQLGTNLIDTAEGYRGAEECVGKAVKGIRNQFIIATKVWPSNFRYRDLIESAENSLRRLGTDYIDIYQLHWPNPTIPIDETIRAMEDLVDAGKIRYIGVSNFSLRRLKQACDVMTNHKIVSVQASFSLIDWEMSRQLLNYCVASNIMFIAYSPLCGDVKNIIARDKYNALQKISEQTGKTPAQIALNWCISKENVIAIPKTNSIERIRENSQAIGWQLTPQQIKLLESSFKNPYHSLKYFLRQSKNRFFEAIGLRRPVHKIKIKTR